MIFHKKGSRKKCVSVQIWGGAANLTVKNCAKLAMKGQEIGREIIRSAANSPMGSRRASPVNQRKRFHVNHQEMNSTPRE